MRCIRVGENLIDISEVEYRVILTVGEQALDCYGK